MSLRFSSPIEDIGPVRLPLPATDGLSGRDRQIVSLAPGRTYAAVAAELGVSRGTVSGAIHRARQRARMSGFDRIVQDNIAEGLTRRPSLYVTHPHVRP